jgi:hypothetical protein
MTQRQDPPSRAIAATIAVALIVGACWQAVAAPASIAPAPTSTAPASVATEPSVFAPVMPPSGSPSTAPQSRPYDAPGPVEVSRAELDQLRLPAGTPSPPDRLAHLDPPPVSDGPFSIELYRKGDFASEATKWYCVPAAIQTMMNIMSPGADHSRGAQDRYYRLARRYSSDRLVGRGAEPEGWATVLERAGFGDYEVIATKSRRGAIRAAATALRLTGRPVGLVVWRGAHAWVMSGFRATADPAVTDDFRVSHVDIEDVWYPRVSSIWGRSRPPGTRVPVEALDRDYLRWHRPAVRYREKDGLFVLVIPVGGRRTA